MNKTFLFVFAIVGLSILAGLGQQEVIGQTEVQKNSFQYCFNQGVAVLHLIPYLPTEETNNNYSSYGSFFHPNVTIINTTDLNNNPTWNTMIRNMCNFLHEKTGIWIPMSSQESGAYGPEFILRYWNTLPENFKEFIIDGVSFKPQ